jgi:hypothetical protein
MSPYSRLILSHVTLSHFFPQLLFTTCLDFSNNFNSRSSYNVLNLAKEKASLISIDLHRDVILGMSYLDGEKRVREAEMNIEMVSFVFKDFFLTIWDK